MAENKIRLEYRKIDELIPYEHNAKLHPPEQIRKLVRSFNEFGRIVPAGIDAEGHLIFGHGRIMAARERGDTDFPCVVIDHLSEDQRRAFVHADNLLAESETDAEILRGEMIALQAAGFDITVTGYDPAGIALAPLAEVIEDDAVLSLPETPRSRRGQVWQLGRHRLMCGDSASADDVQVCVGGGACIFASHGPAVWRQLYGHRQRRQEAAHSERRENGRGSSQFSCFHVQALGACS